MPESKKPNRNQWLPKIRVSNDELELFKGMAALHKLGVSEFVRRACHYYKQDIAVIDKKLILSLNRIAKELNAIGNNLNQITRKSHIHGEPDYQKIAALESQVNERLAGLDELLEALGHGS